MLSLQGSTQVNKNNDNPLFKGIPQYKIVNLIIKFTNILKNKGIPIDEQFISKFEFTKENNKIRKKHRNK